MYGIRCITFVLCYVVQAVLVEADDPPGHLQPIGSHMPPMHIEERKDFPNPIEFYDNYVAPGKPVLFKGAAKQFPSYNNWKNDTYLSEVYGSMYIAAETAKKEDRNNPIREMNFTTFLSLYEVEDIYMVQYLTPPQPITKEMFVPKSLLCPGFLELLNMALLWFSSGGTKSVLHNDSFENINCLFDGTKELIMIDRKHKELVPIDNWEKGYSSVDVERVDMYKYPTLSKLPWYIANMDTGDCLYIPMNWYHHVNSSMARNLAINLWWREHENGFEHREECEKSLQDIPEYDRLFNYHLSSGIKVEDLTFSEAFAENGTTTLRNLLRTVARLSPKDMKKEDLRNILKDVKVIFIHSDINDDKILTVKELESFVQTDLLEPFIKENSNYYKQNQYKDKNDEL